MFNEYLDHELIVYPEPENPLCGKEKEYPPSCKTFVLDDYELYDLILNRNLTRSLLNTFTKDQFTKLCNIYNFRECSKASKDKQNIIDVLLDKQAEDIRIDKENAKHIQVIKTHFNSNKFTKANLNKYNKTDLIMIAGMYGIKSYIARRHSEDELRYIILDEQKSKKS